jgi:DeoR family transcriptional regulator of aga operon
MNEAVKHSKSGINQRHEKLLDALKERGTLSISELADSFKCSLATIRRDVQELESQGYLRRFHGAVALQDMITERAFHEKSMTNRVEKEAIANVVAQWIPDHTVVGLNGGTTTTTIAEKLVELKRSVTVVTNAVNIAFLLSDGGLPVVVIGGELRPQNYETTGSVALGSLSDLHLDWALLGANGVDHHFGVTTTTEQEAAVGRMFAERADNVLLAVDSTKVGHTALFRMLSWNMVNIIATDGGASKLLRAWGISPMVEVDNATGLWKVPAGGLSISGPTLL